MEQATIERPEQAGLSYPLDTVPGPGEAIPVAPGVLWLRKRLPGPLNHINVWALQDGDGWTLVDTGMQTADAASDWHSAFLGPLAGKPIKRVITTHMHPDHIGMAGWLTRRFDCRLWTTRLEYLTCRMLVADTGREAPSDGVRFYRAAGWDNEALERYKARFGEFGKHVHALPDSFHRVTDGDEIDIGGRTWHAVIGRGHSPEHLCLHCPQIAVLISGDQVLPRITSNVSVFPTEPDSDPLGDWLESQGTLKRRVPDDVLVLPSHNEPFRGLHFRLDQLHSGHEQKLQALHEVLAQPKRAVDVFEVLFRRRIVNDVLAMAIGESLAHLNCLIQRGQITRRVDQHGVAWYQSTGAPAAAQPSL